MSTLLHLGDTLIYDHFLKVIVYTWVCVCVSMGECTRVRKVCGLPRLTLHVSSPPPCDSFFFEAGFLTSLGSLIFLDCCVVSKPQSASWSRSLDLPFHHHRT